MASPVASALDVCVRETFSLADGPMATVSPPMAGLLALARTSWSLLWWLVWSPPICVACCDWALMSRALALLRLLASWSTVLL